MFDLLNSSVTLLYDLVVQAFANYYVAPYYFFSLSPGTSLYDLPDDFYKMITLEQVIGPNQFATLFPFNETDRNSVLYSSNNIPAVDMRMRYVKACPVYADLTDAIDGHDGWDDLIVTDMAIAMLESEESDTSALQARKAELKDRIGSVSKNRDLTSPGTVTDVTAYDFGFLQNALQYRFYGNQVELINQTYLGV